MVLSKKEIQGRCTDLKISKKAKHKKLACWLLIDLIIAVFIFVLLHYKPGRYKPSDFDGEGYEQNQVSPYLTHELLPKIHNEAQYGKPFDVVVSQDGINEVIAGLGWPKSSDGILLYAPAAIFMPGRIALMGTANIKGVEFIITIELQPKIDERGLLNLPVEKIKIGAMNITPLAKITAKKMYAQRLASVPMDADTVQMKIAASLLNDEPFEPVFNVNKGKVKIEKITIHDEKLIIRFAPVS